MQIWPTCSTPGYLSAAASTETEQDNSADNSVTGIQLEQQRHWKMLVPFQLYITFFI